MKSAVIITSDNYPCGDAGAVREHAFAKMLQDMGYHVDVLGYGPPAAGSKGNYDGVDYVTFRPNSSNRIIRAFFRLLFGVRIMDHLRRLHQKPELLLVVEVLNPTYRAIERYAAKNGCKLIHDSVEWYSPEQFKNGTRNRTYRAKDKLNREIMNQRWSVIAISKFLHAHFEKICHDAVYIPVIMDIQKLPFRTTVEAEGKVRFVYAGSPGRKDYLAVLLEGFGMLSKEQLKKTEIHLYGTTRQQLVDICGVSESVLDKLDACVTAHGRVPRETAVQAVLDADYSMLLRDENLRYAKAGFPTKIVECLSCGTIPFCNLSSDLGMYLQDGKNAVLIDGHTPEAVKIAAEKALAVSEEGRNQMRANARKTAEDYFDYRIHYRAIQQLIQKTA